MFVIGSSPQVRGNVQRSDRQAFVGSAPQGQVACIRNLCRRGADGSRFGGTLRTCRQYSLRTSCKIRGWQGFMWPGPAFRGSGPAFGQATGRAMRRSDPGKLEHLRNIRAAGTHLPFASLGTPADRPDLFRGGRRPLTYGGLARRMSWSTARTRTPNIRWQATLAWPRTVT